MSANVETLRASVAHGFQVIRSFRSENEDALGKSRFDGAYSKTDFQYRFSGGHYEV